MPRMGSLYIFTIAHHSLPGVVIKTDGAPKNSLYSAVINSLGCSHHGGMQSVPSSAQYFLSKNSLSFRGQPPLGCSHHGGMQSVPSLGIQRGQNVHKAAHLP